MDRPHLLSHSSFDGQWVVFTFWVLRIALLWAMVCKCLNVCFQFFGYIPRGGIAESLWASLIAQLIKNLPAMWETQVWLLGRGDPPEKEMATYSSILTWEIPCTEEPGGLQSMGWQRVRHDWACMHASPSLGEATYSNLLLLPTQSHLIQLNAHQPSLTPNSIMSISPTNG